jgi:hypothetical protein
MNRLRPLEHWDRGFEAWMSVCVYSVLYVCMYVCMYKGWAIKLTLAPRPLMIYCASPLATAMIITVAALRIVLAHGSKPT